MATSLWTSHAAKRNDTNKRAGMAGLQSEITYEESRTLMQGKLWTAVKEVDNG